MATAGAPTTGSEPRSCFSYPAKEAEIFDLTGKVAIVTGASSPQGIGYETAKRLALAGASLMLVAEATAEQLDAAVAKCRSFPNAGTIQPLLMDLGQAGAAEEMVARAEALFGRIDILINNAATRETRPFGTFSREHFDRVVALNLAAPFFASQAAVPIMRKQGGGRIIHVASQLGHVVSPQRALYGVTKAALIHLTKSMALELSPDNIIVNAISPGPTGTPRLLNYNDDVLSNMEAQIPLGRLGQPEEIADLAFYLATSCPSFLCGQAIVIDGGYIIH